MQFISLAWPALALLSQDAFAAPASKSSTAASSTQAGPSPTTTSGGSCSASGPSDFVGFGFETAFLNNFANSFSENLVNSIAQRIPGPVIIRVGGTSGDLVEFDPNQADVKVCVAGDCPAGSGATYILGPSYFDGFKSFADQQFTFQAPLGPVVNTTRSLEYVTHAYDAIGANRVDAIAIGNEVDAYPGYTAQDYVDDAKALEANITDALGISDSTRIFGVPNLADGGSGDFTIPTVFDDGIDSNSNVKYASAHWYQVPNGLTDFSPESEQTNLMSHNAIVSKFNTGYGAAIQYLQANDPAVGFVISESGSSLIGPPLQFQDAFGAALWNVDFDLYAMSQGVKRVDASGRPAAPHSYWVPDDSANDPSLGDEQNIGPQVRGPYYALPMVADFVGNTPGKVVELLGNDLATAYAMYDPTGSHVDRVALVNLKFWSADVDGARGSQTFAIPVPDDVTAVTVERLQAKTGAHALGYDNQGDEGTITWAGETWSYQLDQGQGSTVSGVPASQTIDVCDGVANVEIPDSEAAIIYLGWRNGGS